MTDAECWTCHHPASAHLVETPGDPLSCAPCSSPIGPPSRRSVRLFCDCPDYDGMDHPDRPSLADTVVYRIDSEVGYL